MNGLDICEAYYREYGEPMLQGQFPSLLPHIAVGLFGSGSECFGFDDETSRDHDFEPGFIIMLPGEDVVDRKAEFALERAYAKLPREFMGLSRQRMAPVGGARHGVMRISDFLREKTGSDDGVLTVGQWLETPANSLAEAVNGRIFHDGSGELSRIRAGLVRYPDDIRRKKLAGHVLLAAQAGQYNYLRCLKHGEAAAAQLAAIEFSRHAMSAAFLLNDVYEPYYKWSFRAMRELHRLPLLAELLEYLITTDNDGQMAQDKYDVIEGIAADIIDELVEQNLTQANCGDLEKHAYSINDGIADAGIRNMHILAAV